MVEVPVWFSSVLWPAARVSRWRLGSPSGHRRLRLVAPADPASATQFLPWHAASILASARRASDDRSLARQLTEVAGVAGLLSVGALASSRRVAVDVDPLSPDDSLAGHITAELGLGAVSAIVLCGPPRANQKPILQLHDRRGRTLAYVKVAWNALTTELLAAERAALLGLAGMEHPDFVVPGVLGHGDWADGSWLAIAPVGVHRRRRPDQDRLDRVARSIERTSTGWRGRGADAPFVHHLLARVAALPASRVAVERVLHRHADGELSLMASHGDFVPWNILSGADTCAVWDWERYAPLAPAGYDRIHHRVQVAIQRDGSSLADAVARVDATLHRVVPELSPAAARAHLDWYLAEVLARYEHDAQTNPTPRLLERVASLTLILEQRMSEPINRVGSAT